MSKDKVDQSGFQLDKKELLEPVPLVAKGIVGGLIDAINKLDVNHDGKADIAQLAPFVIKAVPFIVALAPLVDLDKLTEWFVAHDFIKDKAAAKALFEKLGKIALEASKLAPGAK